MRYSPSSWEAQLVTGRGREDDVPLHVEAVEHVDAPVLHQQTEAHRLAAQGGLEERGRDDRVGRVLLPVQHPVQLGEPGGTARHLPGVHELVAAGGLQQPRVPAPVLPLLAVQLMAVGQEHAGVRHEGERVALRLQVVEQGRVRGQAQRGEDDGVLGELRDEELRDAPHLIGREVGAHVAQRGPVVDLDDLVDARALEQGSQGPQRGAHGQPGQRLPVARLEDGALAGDVAGEDGEEVRVVVLGVVDGEGDEQVIHREQAQGGAVLEEGPGALLEERHEEVAGLAALLRVRPRDVRDGVLVVEDHGCLGVTGWRRGGPGGRCAPPRAPRRCPRASSRHPRRSPRRRRPCPRRRGPPGP